MVFLEDLIPQLSRFAIVKERILFAVLPLKPLIRRFAGKAPTSLDAIATIIFSSGSTGVPKGIVLSHKNILSNILGLSQVFDVGEKDRIIGVLPFFHAFGFTATLWFPLIGGFTAVYHVNPLDAKTVGELAQKYKATLLVATPTFLLAYTRKCTGEQFATMRYVITGAERLRDSIAAAFEEKFGKVPLEGYGCTELSPVATVNVPNISMGEISQVGRKAGMIGHPIPGVSVRIANPDTLEPLPQGEKGVLLVKGLNVMQGYLDEPEKTREVIHDGWYVTGDIAMVDNDGFVRIVDRLSRFSKIGGEMVPHVLIEEKLQQLAGRTETAFVVTGVPDERRGEQLVVLYLASAGLSIDALFAAAQASDLPKLWIPAKENFFKIDAIPYLGTGKLDLTALRTLATTKIGKDCTNIDNLL
jgi:acyl-[acyl-carrier-protein]-phospholipid O-acyltransferase / long-chain-fatty-acid--[acyl-carrier-protein] ligase